MRLRNKVCIITGSANGIGLAAAKKFCAEGAIVIVCDLDAGQVADAVKGIEATGGKVAGYVVNVADRATVDAMVADVKARFGRIDVLVNNAGINRRGNIMAISEDDWDATFAVNIDAMFHLCRAVIPQMIEKGGGAIVNTASVAAPDGQVGQASYAASKAAIVGMTLPIARDLMGDGIRVNTILPGIFNTPLLQAAPDNVKAALAASVPFPKRLGEPEEYAHLAETLIVNRYLNGESIRIDGAIRMAPR